MMMNIIHVFRMFYHSRMSRRHLDSANRHMAAFDRLIAAYDARQR
jgi:hypothetical protein